MFCCFYYSNRRRKYMKKFLVIIVLAVLFLQIAFVQGCSSDNSKMRLNSKYYLAYTYNSSERLEELISNDEIQYIEFKDKSTGVLRDRDQPYDSITNSIANKWYIVKFNYTFIDDESVVITYRLSDKEYDDETYENTEKAINTILAVVSKDIVGLGSSVLGYYYNINYLKKLNYVK